MPAPAAIAFLTLAAALALFITERLRADVVALLVLLTLTVSGTLEPAEALAGFGSTAVITMWAVFILSGALQRTGIAGTVGRSMLAWSGTSEARLVAVVMLAAGLLGSVMNNVGAVALLLPVVMDLAQRTKVPPSRLLMPMTIASLFGGMMTLIGTPPNILVSEALVRQGLAPLRLLDFAPTGIPLLLAGLAFMTLVGRRLLPRRNVAVETVGAQANLDALFAPGQHHVVLRIPDRSALAGHTLGESRLRSALGLNVLAILRPGGPLLAPPPTCELRGGDRLLVEGPLDRLRLLPVRRHLRSARRALDLERLKQAGLDLVELPVTAGSPLAGSTLRGQRLRQRLGVEVVALCRDAEVRRQELADLALVAGDCLLGIGPRDAVERLVAGGTAVGARRPSEAEVEAAYRLHRRLLALSVPRGSALDGVRLADSHLADAFGVTVLAAATGDGIRLLPAPDAVLRAGDELLVVADPEGLRILRALRGLVVERHIPVDLAGLESPDIGLAAVVLSPASRLVGRTLREIHFREKYGLNVIAVWRGGAAIRADLRDLRLRLGDALVLHGARERLRVLGGEPDFLVLTAGAQAPPRSEKAPLAIALLVGLFLVPLVLGWLHVAVAGVLCATAVVICGCLTMDEAYRDIDWRAVFLVAGMLSLGVAMEKTGAADLVTSAVVGAVGHLGPLGVVSGILAVTMLGAQFMPSAAVAVLMAPIAIKTALDLGLSPYALAMTVAIGSSTGFLTPVGHPVNTMVMGPGGYRFSDYGRAGLPLAAVVFVLVLVLLPLVWPLHP